MAALLATQAETTQCFKVKEVIGVSLCMEQMSAAERRVGRERADEEIRCQVRVASLLSDVVLGRAPQATSFITYL